MPRRAFFLASLIALGIAAYAMLAPGEPSSAQTLPGVSQVAANKPSFAPGETIIITVVATDDQGTLRISSSLPGSTLDVTGCSVNDQASVGNTCTGTRTAVSGQGTRDIYVQTEPLDGDGTSEPSLRVTLNLKVETCSAGTAVTVDADQPDNAGPDLVTINCIPNTPTPTPTSTPSPTSTPPNTPVPTSTGVPPTSTPRPPTATPVTQVLSSGIQPPNTGDAGLK
jgi:hypothetical protein